MNDTVAPEDATEDSPKAGKKGLIIVIALGVVLLAGGGGGIWFWKSRQASPEVAGTKVKPSAPLQFHALDPAFVVNFQGSGGARFLQLEVRVASREGETIALLKANDPVIRNDLLMLFGVQNQAALSDVAGKEQLREQTLTAVRGVVEREGGKGDSVESVLFTSFVMQ